MHLSETIRVKYASGLYSNTELVLEYAPLLGALQIMKILSYQIDEDIRPDLKERCLEMPKVHEIYSLYHRELRQCIKEIEDTLEKDSWKDREFQYDSKRLKFKLKEQLRDYPWVTPEVLAKMYHD